MALKFSKPVAEKPKVDAPKPSPHETQSQNNVTLNRLKNLNTIVPGINNGLAFNRNVKQPQQAKVKNPMEGLPRSLMFYADRTGCSYWRMHMPASLMNYSNQAVIDGVSKMVPNPDFYRDYKSIVIQRQMTVEQIQFVKFLLQTREHVKRAGEEPFRIIYEIDDICVKKDIPSYNACKTAYEDESLFDNMKEIVNMCDEMLVPSEFMRDYYRHELGFDKITVVPNYASKDWFDGLYNKKKILHNYDKNKNKPRVLYAGSSTHFDLMNFENGKDDFAEIADTINKTCDKYQWVFFGGVPPILQPLVHQGKLEVHDWVHITQFPRKLAELNCQISIAPLVFNNFNRAKASIKFSEACHIGMPFVGQNLEPYKSAFHKFDNGSEMVDHIDAILKDYENESDRHREHGNTIWLDDHLHEFYLTYFTSYDDPVRKKDETFARFNP